MRRFVVPLFCTGLLAGSCISSGNLRNEKEEEAPKTVPNVDGVAGFGGGRGEEALPKQDVHSSGGKTSLPVSPVPITSQSQDCFATDPPAKFANQQTAEWTPGTFAAVERREGTLDVVVLRDGKAFYESFDERWQKTIELGQPIVATVAVTLVTLTLMKNGDRLDLFAIGSDRELYHRFTLLEDPDTFSARPLNGPYALWSNVREMIPGSPEVAAESEVAATSSGPGHLDVFWWTPKGNLAHISGQDYRWWLSSESGDTSPYLKPLVASGGHLAAASPGNGEFHVLAAVEGDIAHHWFDGFWNWEALRAQDFCTNKNVKLTDIFAISSPEGGIEIYGPSASGIRRTIIGHDIRWRIGSGTGSSLLFDQVLIDANPQHLGAVSGLGNLSSLWINDGSAISHFSTLSPE